MRLPEKWAISAIEMELYDCGADSLTLRVTSDASTPYLELSTTRGVVLERGDLALLHSIAERLFDTWDALDQSPATERPA